jgi:hypothetical protein
MDNDHPFRPADLVRPDLQLFQLAQIYWNSSAIPFIWSYPHHVFLSEASLVPVYVSPGRVKRGLLDGFLHGIEGQKRDV